MRIVKRWVLLLLFGALCLPVSSCRPLLKEVFKTPKVRVVDIGIAGNPFVSRGPVEAILHLAVNNPNSYALTVASVAYSATVGTRRLADGERTEEIRIEPSGETVVTVPVRLQTDVFADALREVLEARSCLLRVQRLGERGRPVRRRGPGPLLPDRDDRPHGHPPPEGDRLQLTGHGGSRPSRTASRFSVASRPIASRVSPVALPRCGRSTAEGADSSRG